MKTHQGFTMVELLTAVAVVGILALVALPAYRGYLSTGAVDNCINHIRPARMVADNIIQVNSGSAVGVTATSIGLTAGAITSSNCDSVAVNGDALGNVTISGTVNTSLGSNTLSLVRVAANGAWTCTSSNASMGTLDCP